MAWPQAAQKAPDSGAWQLAQYAPMANAPSRSPAMTGLEQHRGRFLDELFQGLQEFGAGAAIHHPVIGRHGDGHHSGDFDLATPHDRPLLARADRDDAALRRVDDGSE